MKRDSNVYIFIYSIVMVVVVAVLLALASTALKPAQLANVRMEKRLNILEAIRKGEEAENAPSKMEAVNALYKRYIVREEVVNGQGRAVKGCSAFDIDLRGELECKASEKKLPVFVAELKDGSIKYIFPLAGQGLWGPIWGYIALNADLSTVYGVSFGNKAETPGLGAEIVSEHFRKQFEGKKIFQGSTFVALKVLKGGGASKDVHAVDGISGGTLTSNGVQRMLLDCLKDYVPYMEARKREGLSHE